MSCVAEKTFVLYQIHIPPLLRISQQQRTRAHPHSTRGVLASSRSPEHRTRTQSSAQPASHMSTAPSTAPTASTAQKLAQCTTTRTREAGERHRTGRPRQRADDRPGEPAQHPLPSTAAHARPPDRRSIYVCARSFLPICPTGRPICSKHATLSRIQSLR